MSQANQSMCGCGPSLGHDKQRLLQRVVVAVVSAAQDAPDSRGELGARAWLWRPFVDIDGYLAACT